MVAGGQLHLEVEVGPVRRERRQRIVPALGEQLLVRRLLDDRLTGSDQRQLAADPLGVESGERASDGSGSRPGSVSRGGDEEECPCSARHQRPEQRAGSGGPALIGDAQRKPCIRPVRGKVCLDALPLRDEGHGPEHKLTPVAKVESKRGSLSQERLREFLREMLLIRHFEEKVEERFRAGELPGFLHVAIGQEAVAVGVCQAMEDGDVFASTHRAHGHTLARGTHPNEVMAELYGKLEGCSHGYGGSMHLYDVERGNLGANAVVGGGLPAITGAALAFKLRGEPRVSVAFFGDGATNIGTFHESLNLGQLWKVPAVYVLENNHYAESTPAAQQLPIQDMEKRAVAFGMHSAKVDGQDVEAVHRAAKRALDYARSGKGPVLLVCETYRLVGHYVGDPQVYRPKGEQQELRETQDPIVKLREKLGLADEEFDALDQEAQGIADASVAFAKSGTDPKPEDALKNVYA